MRLAATSIAAATFVGILGLLVLQGSAGSTVSERRAPGDGCVATVPGSASPDVILGDGGGAAAANDLIAAGDGYDTVHGFQGNDCLYGEAGADWIGGYDGDDLVSGQLGADTLYGGAGTDRVLGDAKKPIKQAKLPTNVDLLDGGPGKDVIVGGFGPDELYGGDGYDVCIGGPDGADAAAADDPVGPRRDWKDKYYGCEETRE